MSSASSFIFNEVPTLSPPPPPPCRRLLQIHLARKSPSYLRPTSSCLPSTDFRSIIQLVFSIDKPYPPDMVMRGAAVPCLLSPVPPRIDSIDSSSSRDLLSNWALLIRTSSEIIALKLLSNSDCPLFYALFVLFLPAKDKYSGGRFHY